MKELGIDGLSKSIKKAAKGPAEKIYKAVMKDCELYNNTDKYIDLVKVEQKIDCELELLENQQKTLEKLTEQLNGSL